MKTGIQNHDNFFNDLLTMEELLAFLKDQYSKHTIYRWVQKENLPHIRIKGKLWFPRKLICKWLNKNSEFRNF